MDWGSGGPTTNSITVPTMASPSQVLVVLTAATAPRAPAIPHRPAIPRMSSRPLHQPPAPSLRIGATYSAAAAAPDGAIVKPYLPTACMQDPTPAPTTPPPEAPVALAAVALNEQPRYSSRRSAGSTLIFASWTGLAYWTGLDWTGLDWTIPGWTGLESSSSRRYITTLLSRHIWHRSSLLRL